MLPAFWLTVRVRKIRIPIFLPIAFILFLAVEIIAFLPLIVIAIVKKRFLFFRIATGFYLTRLFFALIFFGRKFRVNICDGNGRVSIAGKWLSKLSSNEQPSLCANRIQNIEQLYYLIISLQVGLVTPICNNVWQVLANILIFLFEILQRNGFQLPLE